MVSLPKRLLWGFAGQPYHLRQPKIYPHPSCWAGPIPTASLPRNLSAGCGVASAWASQTWSSSKLGVGFPDKTWRANRSWAPPSSACHHPGVFCTPARWQRALWCPGGFRKLCHEACRWGARHSLIFAKLVPPHGRGCRGGLVLALRTCGVPAAKPNPEDLVPLRSPQIPDWKTSKP